MTADNSENQDIDYKIKLQDQAIQNLKNQFEETNKYQDLRKNVLDSKENTIGWWLAIFAIFFALFGAIGFFVAEDKIQKFEELNEKAENELEKIKQYTETAKRLTYYLKKKIINPYAKLSEKELTEVEQFGTKLEKMIAEARKLQKDDKIEQAIALWQEIIIIAKYENNKEQQADGYFYLGYLYVQYTTDYDKSIEFSQQAIEIKTNYYGAYNNIGVAYYKLGGNDNLQKAIDVYKKAIEIEPNKYEAYNNMGNAYGDLGGEDNLQKALAAYQKAIAALQKAIEIKPDKHEVYYNMAIAYRKLGGDDNLQKAIDVYKKAIEIDPDNYWTYRRIGDVYEKLGGEDNLQKAIAAYQKAIEIKPDLHEAYNNMGFVYYKLGGEDNLQKAITAYQKAIKIKPDYWTYRRIGDVYEKLGGEDNLQKAIAAYQKAIEIKPDNYWAYYKKGNAYQKLGQYDKAINAYEWAIKISPETVKHSKQENWDELNTWIEILDDSATKKKYQAILKKLKGE